MASLLLNMLQSDEPEASIPVIVLSGRNKATHQDLVLDAGASVFLQKPADTERSCSRRIERVLRGRRCGLASAAVSGVYLLSVTNRSPVSQAVGIPKDQPSWLPLIHASKPAPARSHRPIRET